VYRLAKAPTDILRPVHPVRNLRRGLLFVASDSVETSRLLFRTNDRIGRLLSGRFGGFGTTSEVGRTEPLDRLQRAWPIQARRHAAQHAQEYLAERGLSCRTRALCVASLDESRVSPAALMRAPGAGRSRVGAEMSCGGIVLARLAGRSHHRPSSWQRQSRVRQRWPMPCPS
jgi:hypothetical protein